MIIDFDLREIPDEGLALNGEISENIFELPATERIRPILPLSYQARAYIIEGELTIEGDFQAEFELECSRCLKSFVFQVKLQAHELTENLENPTEADLTQALREDILLALPVYPHCEEGKIPRKCPAEGKFETSGRAPLEAGSADSDAEAPNPWAELDKIDGLDKSAPD